METQLASANLPLGHVWTAHLLNVTVSIRVMAAGDGYRYLLNSVVTGDRDRYAASSLTMYYLKSGILRSTSPRKTRSFGRSEGRM